MNATQLPSSAPLPRDLYRASDEDQVAVAMRDLAAGETISFGHDLIQVRQSVPRGHKIAIRAITRGRHVRKYGAPIGLATANIAVGMHVHTHNLQTLLSETDEYEYLDSYSNKHVQGIAQPLEFLGFRRANGRVGTRNEIWILCTVGCVGRTAERIARLAADKFRDRVDNVIAFPHQFGCSQLGGDLDRTRRLIASLAMHPNAGGVLILGLGCESNQLSKLLAEIPEAERGRLRYFAAQAADDETEAGLKAVEELVSVAEQDRREPCGLQDLVVGLKCGRSDFLSGITANPLVGRVADRITEAGGTAILTEIPEILGAERFLMERAASRAVFEGIVSLVEGFKSSVARGHDDLANGISTLEEQSLGAIKKSGRSPVTQILGYGERAATAGLALLEAPGNDSVSATALVAAGATIVLFTTGAGTPLGSPVPTLKISSNSALADLKANWIDYDAGPALDPSNATATTEELLRLIVATASGNPTRNELNEQREIAIWKDGVTL